MKRPRLTIVTAAFNLISNNRRDFFAECIQSVHQQTYKNFEHIIIDGASTDGTIDVLKEYEKKGWIKYISEKDNGLYDAFNKGIKNATGDYIAFLGSDDFYTDKNAFEKIANKIAQNNPDWLIGTSSNVNLSGAFLSYAKPNVLNFPFTMIAGHQTMFMSKKMLIELGCFDIKYKVAADFDISNRAVFDGYKFDILTDSFVAFRKGGVSNHTNCAPEYAQIIQKMCDLTYEQAFDAHNAAYLPQKTLSKILSNVSAEYTKQILQHNKKRRLKPIIKKLLILRLRRDRRHIKLFGINFIKEKL